MQFHPGAFMPISLDTVGSIGGVIVVRLLEGTYLHCRVRWRGRSCLRSSSNNAADHWGGEACIVTANDGWAVCASNRNGRGDERQSDRKGEISYQVWAQLCGNFVLQIGKGRYQRESDREKGQINVMLDEVQTQRDSSFVTSSVKQSTSHVQPFTHPLIRPQKDDLGHCSHQNCHCLPRLPPKPGCEPAQPSLECWGHHLQ